MEDKTVLVTYIDKYDKPIEQTCGCGKKADGYVKGENRKRKAYCFPCFSEEHPDGRIG